jgi:predicted transcriptional regulator
LFQRHRSHDDIGRALAILLEYGLVRMVKDTETGGRPTERWYAV